MSDMDIHFSSKSADWETPQLFWEKMNDQFAFTCDVCASAENAKTPFYYTEKDDALRLDWIGRCWMNPPYGRGINKWLAKAWNEVFETRNASIVVALVPARVDTSWWHLYCAPNLHRFIKGRLAFELGGESMKDGKGHKMNAPFPSALVYFGL